MPKVSKIEMKCEKCGKPQGKDDKRSTENFDVFDCKQKCSCGGKYVMYIDGQKIG